jgi:hypothetical protein
MAVERSVSSPAVPRSESGPIPAVYAEGLLAGMVGAVTIAIWFLIVDAVNGRPLYTPTVLGTALFGGGAGLEAPETLQPSFEMALSFTWVHVLVFLVIGVAGAWLLSLVEKNPSVGFGVVILFVFFECGFLLASTAIAEPVLHALAWPAVLVGNLLAAAAMAATYWWRHPHLTIRP